MDGIQVVELEIRWPYELLLPVANLNYLTIVPQPIIIFLQANLATVCPALARLPHCETSRILASPTKLGLAAANRTMDRSDHVTSAWNTTTGSSKYSYQDAKRQCDIDSRAGRRAAENDSGGDRRLPAKCGIFINESRFQLDKYARG